VAATMINEAQASQIAVAASQDLDSLSLTHSLNATPQMGLMGSTWTRDWRLKTLSRTRSRTRTWTESDCI